MDDQDIAVPLAGKDCPRNWNECIDGLGSEEACLACPTRGPALAVAVVSSTPISCISGCAAVHALAIART